MRVLALLFLRPDESFYLREIFRLAKVPPSNVQREMKLLTEAGLIERSVRGRNVYYQANAKSPIYPDILGIVTKTFGLADILRQALAPLRSEIKLAFIFGSMARNQQNVVSDIDLLVTGDVTFDAVVKQLPGAEALLLRTVNPTIYSEVEFRKKLEAREPFITEVVAREKIFVIGTEDDLKTVAR